MSIYLAISTSYPPVMRNKNSSSVSQLLVEIKMTEVSEKTNASQTPTHVQSWRGVSMGPPMFVRYSGLCLVLCVFLFRSCCYDLSYMVIYSMTYIFFQIWLILLFMNVIRFHPLIYESEEKVKAQKLDNEPCPLTLPSLWGLTYL